MSEFTFTGRVWRTDPKLKGTKLESYDVNLRQLGANWETEGGTLFGGKTGEPKIGGGRKLNINSIAPRNGK